jgi:hypothetical protein
MDAILLTILILIGDPSGEPVATRVAEELARRGGPQVQVVVGAEAAKRLEARGIKARDLLVSPNIGGHLTAPIGKEGETVPNPLIVIHLDRREVAGDALVETRAWLDGRSDRHVAIVGAGADPTAAVIHGVVDLVAHRLRGASSGMPGAAPGAPGTVDDALLAQLAERGQWLDLLGRLAGVAGKTPRQSYYEVLAYAKLGQRDAAVEALNALRVAHPDHFLVAAATELIRDGAADASGGAAPDDGGDTLSDGAPPSDDQSNTLK